LYVKHIAYIFFVCPPNNQKDCDGGLSIEPKHNPPRQNRTH